MPLTDFIDQLELIPLSGEDLIMMTTKLNNPDCRFMLYDDLAGVENISQLFEEGNNPAVKYNIIHLATHILGRVEMSTNLE